MVKLTRNKKNSKKKTFKNHNKNKKGGNPKINFAYTYFLISLEDLKKNNLISFNKYIAYKSKICDCISLNNDLDSSKCNKIPKEPYQFSKLNPKLAEARSKNVPVNLVLNNDYQKLIIIMKYNDIQKIANDITLLENVDFQNQILGHSIIEEKTHSANNKTSSVLAIYDVCLHQIEKKGYGTVLFNSILICIEVNYNNIPDLFLWLGIRVENVAFSKVAYLYVSAGFKEPYITRVDPWNNQLNFDFISLHKPMNNFISDENQMTTSYHKTLDLYNQYQLLKKDPNYTCTLNFSLDKSAILRLRMFPYLGVQGITNISNSNLQREYAGIFNIYNSSINEKVNSNSIIYKLSLETLAENKGIKYISGEEESVVYIDYPYSFHTHPISLYVKYNVLIGTPSGKDVTSFLEKVFSIGAQFHVVIAIEGIYLLSLSSNFILTILQNPEKVKAFLALPDIMNTLSNQYEYPFNKRFFDWKTDSTLPQDSVSTMIQDYLQFIARININNIGPMVNINFFAWNQIDKKTVFSINYGSIYNNCFCNSESIKNIQNIHGITNLYNYTRNV